MTISNTLVVVLSAVVLRPCQMLVYYDNLQHSKSLDSDRTAADSVQKINLVKHGYSLSKDLDLTVDFQWHEPATGSVVWPMSFGFCLYGTKSVHQEDDIDNNCKSQSVFGWVLCG